MKRYFLLLFFLVISIMLVQQNFVVHAQTFSFNVVDSACNQKCVYDLRVTDLRGCYFVHDNDYDEDGFVKPGSRLWVKTIFALGNFNPNASFFASGYDKPDVPPKYVTTATYTDASGNNTMETKSGLVYLWQNEQHHYYNDPNTSGYQRRLWTIPNPHLHDFDDWREQVVDWVNNRYILSVEAKVYCWDESAGGGSGAYCLASTAKYRIGRHSFPRCFGAPKVTGWLKTTLGNVYSKGGFNIEQDYSELDSVLEKPSIASVLVSPFNASKATVASFLVGSGTILPSSLGWGYVGHYNDPVYGISDLTIDNPPLSYDALLNQTKARCEMKKDDCKYLSLTPDLSSIPSLLGEFSGIASKEYKIIVIDGSSSTTNSLDLSNRSLFCARNVIIFLKDVDLTISKFKKVNALNGVEDACLFIADSNSSITIEDLPNDPNGTSNYDLVEASFMMLGNSTLKVKQTPHDNYKDSTNKYDRLILHGFIYTENNPPIFERDLGFSDNKTNPAEWLIFDPTVYKLHPLVGKYKIATVNCSLDSHFYCR